MPKWSQVTEHFKQDMLKAEDVPVLRRKVAKARNDCMLNLRSTMKKVTERHKQWTKEEVV